MVPEPFVGPWPLFSFLIYTQSVGLLGREISPSQGLYLYTERHKQNKRTQTSMGFEPTTLVFERTYVAIRNISDYCLGL
jgi:hypothetical protein